jgi:phthiocerol/phenolphthiocerol synthesis type-I polyketide synthase E
MVAPFLQRQSGDGTDAPVPPNIAYFFDHGLRENDRWFVPLILRLHPGLTVDDVRSVLTAVTNHHDALRLKIVERAGRWEQQIAAPQEFSQLCTRSLPADRPAHDAILAMLAEIVTGREPSQTPLAAAYVTGIQGGSCYLAIAVHHLVVDEASRDILITDIATALGQRLAGADIALQPATMTWREWSQRCAALSTHPAVVGSRDFWLDNFARTTLRIVDHDTAERPHSHDLAKMSTSLSSTLTSELDGAQRSLGLATEEILLAALGRAIARTIGEGVASVDMAGDGRSVLEPDVDLHRTIGWFTTNYPVPLPCASVRQVTATDMLADVHRMLDAVPSNGIGHGLLCYGYPPTAMQLAAQPPSDVLFSYVGTVPELPSRTGRAEFDIDVTLPVRETLPGLGHALQLRIYRAAGLLRLDWWYDIRRMDRSTVEELTEQFPFALIELTSEAIPPIFDALEMTIGSEPLTLVRLSTPELA